MYKQGKAVYPGDTLGIVGPSSTLGDHRLEKGLAVLHQLGYKTKLGASATAHWGYLAGTDELRARDITNMFADDDVDGIICLRGGYGATRLLPLLDYQTIAVHPKVFIGFSDITALHTVFLQRCHFMPIHGTMVMSLGRDASAYTTDCLAKGLINPYPLGKISMPSGWHMETIIPGDVTGTICGGNLMLLAATAGTPYALKIPNAILLIEEVGEEAYSLDRMLCQLEESGIIAHAKGIIFGEFTRCEPTEPAPYEFTSRDIIYQYAKRWNKPAVWGFPAGHGTDNTWLPLGMKTHLCCQADPYVELLPW